MCVFLKIIYILLTICNATPVTLKHNLYICSMTPVFSLIVTVSTHFILYCICLIDDLVVDSRTFYSQVHFITLNVYLIC